MQISGLNLKSNINICRKNKWKQVDRTFKNVGLFDQKSDRMKQKACLGNINWTSLIGVTGPRMSEKEFVFYVMDNGEPLKAFEQEGVTGSK